MFSEHIRNVLYWSLDFIMGSKVKKHYNDIKYLMENVKETTNIQKEYLDKILKYATTNVKFYEPYRNYNDLSDFPIIDKSMIKINDEELMSGEYKDKKLVEMHTSGSTGTPFAIKQNKDKRNRVVAEMLYFWGNAGYRVGMRYIFFRVWTESNRSSKFEAFARNLLMCDIVRLDEENLKKIRQILKKDKKIKMLLGYASTFENLANYLISCNDKPEDFGVETIISGSENLDELTRQKLKKVFGCTVCSLYSNQENGMLAMECVENKEFHLNTASFFIEILDIDKDEPAKEGEMGRIVVTDLFNYAMPLIRYDTGDLARVKEKTQCSWNTRAISNIEGRKVDLIYATDGRPITPHIWSVVMWKYDKLLQYQFIQEGEKEYQFNLNGAEGIYTDEDIIKTVKDILGEDAEVSICHMKQIPVLASGKFKKTICNYKKQEI